MNRLETLFERFVDRLLAGDFEPRIRIISLITLLTLAICVIAIFRAAHLPLSTFSAGMDNTAPLWKILLNQ